MGEFIGIGAGAVVGKDGQVEQINFLAGRRGAVVENDFSSKLEKLNVQAGKRDKILLAHVQRNAKRMTQ